MSILRRIKHHIRYWRSPTYRFSCHVPPFLDGLQAGLTAPHPDTPEERAQQLADAMGTIRQAPTPAELFGHEDAPTP